MTCDSGRHAERGDAKRAPSEGCQSGPKASPERYRDTPTEAMLTAAFRAHERTIGTDNFAAYFTAIYTAMQAARSETEADLDLRMSLEALVEGVATIDETEADIRALLAETPVQDDDAEWLRIFARVQCAKGNADGAERLEAIANRLGERA